MTVSPHAAATFQATNILTVSILERLGELPGYLHADAKDIKAKTILPTGAATTG
jgi:hypothetical protein